MSDHAHAVTATEPSGHVAGHDPVPDSALPIDFDKSERALFDQEDTSAGGNIGKMLALFFVYTIIAMSIAGWWTYRSLID